MHRILPISLLLVALLTPALALAQASSSDEEARTQFERGRVAYDAGDFEAAVQAFRQAYLLSNRPALLYNIGQSELRLEHHALALEAFEGYLRRAPEDDPRRAEVEERVRVLHTMAPSTQDGSEEHHEVEEPTTPSGGGFDPIGGRVFTWVALGLSAALAGSAIGVYYAGAGTYDGLSAGCGSTPDGCSDTEIAASGLPDMELATNILWAAAGAALVSTIVLYIVEGFHGPEQPPASSLRIDVGPTGVALRGTF